MMEIVDQSTKSTTPATGLSLLDCVERLVESERSLTLALSESAHLVSPPRSSDASSSSSATPPPPPPPHRKLPVPTPRTVGEVEEVLALSRTLASRTSAPSGWNPMLPVVTFATPNPLPHQVRGGALASMQLDMAKLERKRKREQQLQKAAGGGEGEDVGEAATSDSARADGGAAATATAADPGKLDEKAAARRASEVERMRARRARQAEEARQVASMNLSDTSSSSEEEEDDDDDDDDDEEDEEE